jgi:protein arginine kinase activator
MSTGLCQSCGQNPATIHFTEIKEDACRELHMCEACANAQGVTGGGAIPAMLASLVEGPRRGTGRGRRCPECGITFEEFRAKGRFGCPRDYEAFEDLLGPVLDKLHGSREHRGRLPRGTPAVGPPPGDRLLSLRRELQQAVKAEEYERAARLRDEIQRAESGASRVGQEPG